MLDAYVGDLRARGRVSAKDVENAFQRHVKKPFPDLCRGLAKGVAAGDIQAILAKLVRKGIRRGVNLLRSHLSAAFQYAAKADNDPTRLAHDGAVFEILANPVALVPRKAEFESVGERNLSPHELHRYWHGLEKVGFPVVRSFLKFDLALGGQRGIQLIRPLWRAYDFNAATVLLKDGKGRGSVVRDHLLPLTEFALEVLGPLRDLNGKETGPFISRGGKSLHPSTVSHVVHEVWEALAAEDIAKSTDDVIEEFSFKDIRRTCETLLASMGVSRDLRSYVLSHGRTGVQDKHYDRWSHLTEKRRVLQKWARFMKKVIAGPDRHGGTTGSASKEPVAGRAQPLVQPRLNLWCKCTDSQRSALPCNGVHRRRRYHSRPTAVGPRAVERAPASSCRLHLSGLHDDLPTCFTTRQ
jgi:integrase